MSSKPDKHYEEFWLTFKGNILGYYPYTSPIVTEIQEISNRLNDYQKKEQYHSIKSEITVYLIKFGWMLLRDSSPHTEDIYVTNMKRWIKLDDFPDEELQLLTKIKHMARKRYDIPAIDKISNILSRWTKGQTSRENYKQLLIIGVEHSLPGLIDSLSKHINISQFCLEHYKIQVPRNIKANKLLNIIKRAYENIPE